MAASKSRAPFRVAPEAARRRELQLTIAGALAAAGMLAAAPPSTRASRRSRSRRPSRRRSAAIRSPASASTRRSSATRFGELDPTDPKNAVIVDIALAPRNANGKVEYSFDFYILKPIDLTQGQPQDDVRAAQSRRQDLQHASNRGAGGNDPGSITDPAIARQHIPDAAGLHDGVERLGLRAPAPTTPTSTRRSRCRSPRIPTAPRSPARPTSTSSPAARRTR